ncbi:MAG: hypothetical protein ACYC0X_04870 [Pirellulaceae bacterium]
MSRKLSPRQAKLAAMAPDIAAGKITKKKAILKAGYKESSAKQQERVLGSVRMNTIMQEALRKAGVTEKRVAEKIDEGLEARRKFAVHDGDDVSYEYDDDYATRHKYVVTAAELLDAFPAKKHQIEDVTPQTYSDIEQPRAKTPEKARKMAEAGALHTHGK